MRVIFPNDRGLLRHTGRVTMRNAVRSSGAAAFQVAPILSHFGSTAVAAPREREPYRWCFSLPSIRHEKNEQKMKNIQ